MESVAYSLVRPMVAEVLDLIEPGWTGIHEARERVFRSRGGLSRGVWGEFIQSLHRTVIFLRRIDFALEGSVSGRDRNRARVIVADLLAGLVDPEAAAKLHSRVDWDSVLRHGERLESIEDPVERLSLRHSLPGWAAAAVVAATAGPLEAERLAAALAAPAPRTLRVNTLKSGRPAVLDQLREAGIDARETRFSAQGIEAPPFADVFRLPGFAAGAFEAQDEASQICAELVAPPPRGRILDACAGAGGKTLSLAALLGGSGRILAADARESKIRTLRERARRAGAHQVRALAVPPDAWPQEVAEFARSADRILVDAPCSGVGSFRRKPEMRWRIAGAGLERLEAIQRELLCRAAAHLAPGARLIYATCTIRREENEDQIDRLLSENPELELIPPKEVRGKAGAEGLADPSGRFLRLLPHTHGTDGFFAAAVRRRRGQAASGRMPLRPSPPPESLP